ncbi:MAG: putative rane protein [Cyanobacteria bacterium RYN_339]|nr:putative rane protein [Cyanobacteria bacterium RYN_339]
MAALYPAPSSVLVPTLLVALALAARGAWLRRGGERPGLRVALTAILVPLVLALGSLAFFDVPARRGPIWLGLALGALMGVLWEWAFPPSERDAADVGPLAGGLAALAMLGLVLEPGVPFANAALGLMAAWGATQIAAVAMPSTGTVVAFQGRGLALAGTALAAGTAAWATRLSTHHDIPGTMGPIALVTALTAIVGLALSELLGPARARFGALVAGLVFVLGGVGLDSALYLQQGGVLLALVAGGVAAVVAGLWLRDDDAPAPAAALGYLVLVGGVLVLENRLSGILAIGLGGLGLLVGAQGLRAPRVLAAIAVAIFAARVWLQLFLDRTDLTGYGVDLTHPYAFAALIIGGLLPGAALALGQICRPHASLAVAGTVALAVLPAWLGYMIHVEALGSLLAGLVLAAFALGARGKEAGAEALALVPALLLGELAVTMLAVPWLVDHMNATRDARVSWLLGSAVVMAVGVGYAWVVRRARPAEPA